MQKLLPDARKFLPGHIQNDFQNKRPSEGYLKKMNYHLHKFQQIINSKHQIIASYQTVHYSVNYDFFFSKDIQRNG